MTTEQRWANKPRPVNLNLATIRFPITAIVSILHRMSGVVLFLFIPFLIWVFERSLASPDDFASLQSDMGHAVPKFLIWAFLAGLSYHMIAGIRHLIMEFGIGENLKSGRLGAGIVMALGIVAAVILGIWLW